jgi:hypothetical protein
MMQVATLMQNICQKRALDLAAAIGVATIGDAIAARCVEAGLFAVFHVCLHAVSCAIAARVSLRAVADGAHRVFTKEPLRPTAVHMHWQNDTVISTRNPANLIAQINDVHMGRHCVPVVATIFY